MAGASAIEWTDATWNPIVGCSIDTPGCISCYAMKMAGRIEAMTKSLKASGGTGAPHYDGTTKKVKGKTVWTGKLALAPESILTEPLRWKKPRRIFVNSMGDLFHEDAPDEWIDRVFAVMALCPQHTFQVLTKRSQRMREYMNERWQPAPAHTVDFGRGDRIDIPAETRGETRETQIRAACEPFLEKLGLVDTDDDDLWTADGECKAMLWKWPLSNVWLGVSAEDQKRADLRIPDLLATPAAVRFVSAEPLIGPIDFAKITAALPTGGAVAFNALRSGGFHQWSDACLEWIIVGGESGRDARPMHPAWARSIRDQCAAAGVPFFFKQWGEWLPGENMMRERPVEKATWQDGEVGRHSLSRDDRNYPEWRHYEPGGPGTPGAFGLKAGKKRAGRLLDGIEHNAFPERRMP